MHRSSVLVVVLTSAFIGVAAARGGGGRHEVTPLERHRAAEQSRLRSHFDSVDVELRAREVSALSEAQRARRETLIAWLRDYRDAGRFPENDRLSFAAPFFRDSRGVLCAMGYLIDRSGRGDIVDDVARSRNNAYIRELADDQRLVAWLDSTGLTVAEAARIQPQYGPPPPSEPSGTTKDKVGSGYELASGMFIAGSVVTSAASLLAPSRAMGMLGSAVGIGGVVIGATGMNRYDNYRGLGTATTVAGGIAVATGVRALLVSRRPRLARLDSHVALAPAMIAPARRVGLALRARF